MNLSYYKNKSYAIIALNLIEGFFMSNLNDGYVDIGGGSANDEWPSVITNEEDWGVYLWNSNAKAYT